MQNIDNKISGILVTLNEEENIVPCIESMKWVDELIVVDTGSTDKTVDLVKKYTNKIFFLPFENNFAGIREKALKFAKYSWILTLDGDEVLVPSGERFLRNLTKDRNIKGYWFSRRSYINKSFYFKHGFFYPDRQLRFFRKSFTRYTGLVHSTPTIDDQNTKIAQGVELYHNPSRSKYDSFLSFRRMLPYIKIEGKDLALKTSKELSIFKGFDEIIRNTYRSFIKLQGYKDGYAGFRASLIHSTYKGSIIFYAIYYRYRYLRSK